MIFPIVLVLAIALASCSPSPKRPFQDESARLTVFAASSLTGAFEEIGRSFEEKHPGVIVNFSFAGSQALRTQIEQGAPADIFASAHIDEMNKLIGDGLVAASAPQVFATSNLVVILPADNPGAVRDLKDLANPGLKLLLAAPDVPVGRYARRFLKNGESVFGGDYSERVIRNVVSIEDNVRQLVAKVQLGEADAAIVYTGGSRQSVDLRYIGIPNNLNITAEYPIAPLINSKHGDLAASFISYLQSSDAQAVLRNWGFGITE